uniref:F-box domain-containing protein n=1 Tax=Lates calcarifer TaxID=8187 RepID=A0A4W6D9S1_LATCA
MDEEFVPMHGKDSVGHWGSLPDVCLRQVFRCLPDGDRRSADMVCRHWHNVMRSPSLWRYRFFHFSGRLSKYRQSEYCSAVAYARYLGVYLERLEVCVCPPRRSLVAQRLDTLFCLCRVRAPLQSLSLVRLELDRSAWTLGLRNCLIDSLIRFLHRGASRLTSVCLNGMRNRTTQGLDLLSALSYSQRRFEPRCYISFLDLEGFFSSGVHIHLDSSVPGVLRELQGLTSLKLSYSCLSDELLMALHNSDERVTKIPLVKIIPPQVSFVHFCLCSILYLKVVCGDTWAALASSCPDLRVKLTVDQIINTDRLARILLREIPLTEFAMTAFYSPDEDWSARPLLRRMLPQYRCSLQYLTLDLSNCSESLDEELLELVKVCERLEQLRVWAFLEIRTVERLLHIRLTQRHLLNKIRVRKTVNTA